jgi:hypothetical protein
MDNIIHLRVLILKEKTGLYIARCLENNLVAQATGIEELQKRFLATVFTHLERDTEKNRASFSGRSKAPELYEKMFNSISNRPLLKSENKSIEAELALSI